jgi:DNA repair protein RadC
MCQFTAEEQKTLMDAASILIKKASVTKTPFTNPGDAKRIFHLKLRSLEHEVFSMAALDSQHCLIDIIELFRGTIDAAAVYPREVIKEALRVNAAAVIFAHNHPSGNSEPSNADKYITEKLLAAFNLMDIRVLDHLVIGDTVTSFAERGLL